MFLFLTKEGRFLGRRFECVRFDCPVSADIAIEKANGSRFMDNTIFVKRASYNKKGLNVRDGDFSSIKSEFVKGSCPSYANVVAGKKSVDFKRFSVKTQEEDIEWLDRSIVARLHTHRDVDSIIEAFGVDGVFNVHIRAMGGNMVLLTFLTSHDMNCPRENLASEGVKSDDEGMDGDEPCFDKRSNVIEHIEENDSSSYHQSVVGEIVSPSSCGVLGGQDKVMVGNTDGGLVDARTIKLLDEVVPDVSGSLSTPIIHEQELGLKGDFSSQIVTQKKRGLFAR
ncbi:hypothetical protein Vadar_014457 [Vaccinium darrowii]|uniref:Uncharacterized protein n=1 Tax=Vaccinium darrowii TaxID=229202 RepID=A0ACB7XA47_9ERIC|nr:hypothetical protein Vadar_014457 [Vaccinium darrowii]